MKTIITIFIIISFVATTEIRGQNKVRIVEQSKVSTNFSDHLEDPAEWEIDEKGKVSLRMDGANTLFLLNDDKEVFRVNSPEYISEVVTSDDGNVIIFLAMKRSGRGGSNYSSLITVNANEKGIKASRFLLTKDKIFGGSRWWVSELGAVSNDGARVLVKLGVMGPTINKSSRVHYSWYTVESSTGKILSKGLSIENSKTPQK